MNQASVLRDKAEMFERRAETATDPVSKQHYREMAAESHCVAYRQRSERRGWGRTRGCPIRLPINPAFGM
jgi:hypothetical protein